MHLGSSGGAAVLDSCGYTGRGSQVGHGERVGGVEIVHTEVLAHRSDGDGCGRRCWCVGDADNLGRSAALARHRELEANRGASQINGASLARLEATACTLITAATAHEVRSTPRGLCSDSLQCSSYLQCKFFFV